MTNTLSVVIPAYQEEKRPPSTLKIIIAYLKKQRQDYEIIVIDDGSKDATSRIAKDFTEDGVRLLSYQPNRGKGYAIRQGVLAARGDYILISDADLSTPIADWQRLKEALENGYDLAIGSRALKKSLLVVRQPLYRELMGRTFNLFIQIVLLPGICDTQCGFKLLRHGIAKKIFPHCSINGFSCDVEILFLARQFGYRIQEVPVRCRHKEQSRAHPLRDSLRMIREVFLIRQRHLLGEYR